jgi:hypothetical protein
MKYKKGKLSDIHIKKLEEISIWYWNKDDIKEWDNNLKKIKKYIDKNHKRPSSNNTNNEIKKLGKWIQTQKQNYDKNIYIMKNQEIYDKWTDFINDPLYKDYFD